YMTESMTSSAAGGGGAAARPVALRSRHGNTSAGRSVVDILIRGLSYWGRVSCHVRKNRKVVSARQAPPRNHQLAGSRSYRVNSGVREAWRAAARGLTVSTASTVRCPKGASRPSQKSSGPAQTASSARYATVVATAVWRNRLLTAVPSSTANTAVI